MTIEFPLFVSGVSPPLKFSLGSPSSSNRYISKLVESTAVFVSESMNLSSKIDSGSISIVPNMVASSGETVMRVASDLSFTPPKY